MQIYIAGSFLSIKDIKKVIELQNELRKFGFNILNQLEPFNLTRLKDFKGKEELAKKIVKHDLFLLKKADIIIALADRPSFGVGAEVIYAKRVLKKKVIAIITKPVKSPWILAHADKVLDTYNLEQIISAIKSLVKT